MKTMKAPSGVGVIRESKQAVMDATPEYCLHPEHGARPATHFGTQCESCYQTVAKAVRERRASWEALQRKGKIRLKVSIEDFWLN